MPDSKITGVAEDAEEMVYSYSWDYYCNIILIVIDIKKIF
jgi:hypothetical protein